MNIFPYLCLFFFFLEILILILLEQYLYYSHYQNHLGVKYILRSLFILTEIINVVLNYGCIRPDHFPLCCLFLLGKV